MASRLNIRFVSAPKQFLERTVVFSDGLLSAESSALSRNRLTHFFDFEPLKERTMLRVLAGQHLYENDTHVTGYFVKPGASTMVPRGDTPHPFVFLSEFTCCRLLVRKDGDDWLRLEMEDNLVGRVPAAESGSDSPYTDSLAYWDLQPAIWSAASAEPLSSSKSQMSLGRFTCSRSWVRPALNRCACCSRGSSAIDLRQICCFRPPAYRGGTPCRSFRCCGYLPSDLRLGR